jgi:uncharacterized membrane protein YcaP (DUF421 family)
METILKSFFLYFFLFFLFRITGKRTMEETTPFGLILILLISSSVADALKDDDKSVTNAILLPVTLVIIHFSISFIKTKSERLATFIGDKPTLLVNDGKLLHDRMKKSRIRKEDILAAARDKEMTSVDEIKYAVLELNGTISVIPKEED